MSKTDCGVAIVIPCYNAGATLATTLESALIQDVPIDVIVIDDGSTDNSRAVASRFEPKVRIVTGPNRGVSRARNTGIAETSAQWIVFLDADDLLEPGTLAQRLAAVRDTNADVVICNWLELHDNCSGQVNSSARSAIDWHAIEANAELATAVHVWATTAAILYPRRIVEKIGGFREDLPVIQDARFLFDAAYHGARFVRSDHIGARYRVHPQSLSRRAPAQFWRDVLTNGKQIEELWRMRGTLSSRQIEALAGIYDHAARGLFAAESTDYFQAVRRQYSLRHHVSLHSRIASPLARTIGLKRARQILRLVGR